MRHGPHQGAQKSATTGTVDVDTDLVEFLRVDLSHCATAHCYLLCALPRAGCSEPLQCVILPDSADSERQVG